MERKYRVRRKRRRERRLKIFFLVSLVIMLVLLVFCVVSTVKKNTGTVNTITTDTLGSEQLFIRPNEYSRPQTPLKRVKGVVIHYVANPGSDAEANRNYFDSLPELNQGSDNPTYASSHYVIGLDGRIVQCIPLNEIAYASNDRNKDTISIECCHPKENGKFTNETYESLVKLTAWLCNEYKLKPDDVIRHYDVTGKDCPRYYVKNEDKWIKLKEDIFVYKENNY